MSDLRRTKRFKVGLFFVPTLVVGGFVLLAGSTLVMAATNIRTTSVQPKSPSKLPISDDGGSVASGIKIWPIKTQPIWPQKCLGGFFSCNLMDKIKETDTFLKTHKNGLSYTPETRTLTPVSEVVRLTIDAQAMGYLDLYEATSDKSYLKEATDRLDAIVSLGNAALAGNSFDGQVGYSMLLGYSMTGKQAYYDFAMRVKTICTAYPDRQMNWGYMCAMYLGKLYQITNNTTYLTEARKITLETSDKQFSDGAWPHQATLEDGKNTSYSSWLMYEMIEYRQYDPEDPDLDYAILNTSDFLERRVNADGSLNYEDEGGEYADDPTGLNSRGWLNDLASIAYNLRATGKSERAEKVLSFLFSLELKGDNLGGYPDKWEAIDPTNSWMTGSPSVVRTSLIFWYIASTFKLNTVGTCSLAAPVTCMISATDCSASYRELNLCSAGGSGKNYCIAGIPTGCFNPDTVHYMLVSDCNHTSNCCYDSIMKKSRITECQTTGYRRCSGTICSNSCVDASYDNQQCTEKWLRGDQCGVSGDESGICT